MLGCAARQDLRCAYLRKDIWCCDAGSGPAWDGHQSDSHRDPRKPGGCEPGGDREIMLICSAAQVLPELLGCLGVK